MRSVKEKYPEASTSRSTRIAIWVIAIVMVGGTLVSFLIYAISSMNPSVNSDQILYEKAVEKAQKQQAEQTKVEQDASQNYIVFGGYEKTTFDAASVTALQVETLKQGDGVDVAETDTVEAYYTGWTPEGVIFDSTADISGANETRSFPLNQVITGWTQGLTGKRVGGVYQLTIPTDMAYGERGSGSLIPPNTPLRFIVQIVSASESE